MRQEMITRSLLRRVTDRSNGLVVLLVGGMFCLFRMLDGRPEVTLLDWAFPFLLLYAHVALSPLPWQWTGDGAPRAGMGRGLAQALLFNAAWIAAFLAMAHLANRPGPPAGPEGWPQVPPPPLRTFPRHRHLDPGWGLGMVNLAFAIAFGWVMAEKEATEARERSTAELLRQSQSRSLQNQLDPHVLYNALNSLTELVHDDPLAAEEALARLADLYRMLTVHGREPLVLLGEERRLVEAYLAMEQMRLGDRLHVTWAWPDWADGAVVPPLFLLTLVENAIKHGVSPCEAGGDVVISCGRDGGRLELRVENGGQPLDAAAPRGVGLQNLEARLKLRGEGADAFTLERVGGRTVASLRWTPEAVA